MRLALSVLLVLSGTFAHAQYRSQVWLTAGVTAEPVKDWNVGVSSCYRLNTAGLSPATWYQELSVKYAGLKWFRPSIDYRYISDWQNNSSVQNTHRLNFNLDFRTKLKRFRPGVRFRYQQLLGNFVLTGTDLDPAMRIKPYVTFMPKKGRIQPTFSTEFFYNPLFGEFGQRFNRVRFGLSAEIDLKGPNQLEITYYFGKRFNTDKRYTEYLLSLEYTFEWKKMSYKHLKKEKKESASQSASDL